MEQCENYGQEELSRKMQGIGLIKNVCFYDCIDSTNLQAKLEAEQGAEEGTLIVADEQIGGRGRRGRVWKSPAGKNIYVTLLLRPKLLPDKAAMLTLVMALAVAKGIEQSLAEKKEPGWIGIKWPNDIVINGKKVCGILTEMTLKAGGIGYVLVGVGMNVHCQDFSPELEDIATSLEQECGQKINRSVLLSNIMKAFERYYTVFLSQGNLTGILDEYHQRLVNRNREVCVLDPQGEYRGRSTGITDTGELCVELVDGSIRTVYAGEVSVRGIYGYV